jgi:hypothetical protein
MGDTPPRPGRQPAGRDPHRQRQPSAARQHPRRRLGLGRRAVAADDRGKQFVCLARIEDLQVEHCRAGQAGHRGAAGDDDRAARAAGQQRADLGHAAGVIQHDQHPPGGEQRPVAGGALRLGLGDGRFGHAEVPQEPREHLGRVQRVGDPLQAHAKLAIGEPVPQPVPDVHGEGGLADAAHPGHGRDDDGARPSGGRLRSQQAA